MRRLLYLSPFFPPQSRVGALRPLKFVRWLRTFGWEPVVLADLRASDECDAALAAQIPADVEVVRDYARGTRTSPVERSPAPTPAARGMTPRGTHSALRRWVDRTFSNPELLPLGEHSVDIPHALAAGRRLLSQRRFDAILTNADPHAALLVGTELGRRFGVPHIADLRDPWAPCELRRPLRPAPQRRLVDALERRVVTGSARVILNTETARAAYVAHYADLPPEHFACIRNHADRDLVLHGTHRRGDRFRILFHGNFRRHVEGDVLIEALGELARRRIDLAAVEFLVTGAIPAEVRARADALGVGGLLVDHPWVPYVETLSFLDTADLLVSLSHATNQRIPAKIYDYLACDRPMLALCDNPELEDLLHRAGGVDVRGLNDVAGVADAFERALRAGRNQRVNRAPTGTDSRTATEALAAVLDRAVEAR